MSEDKRYYLDTSALLPYYREEIASQKLQDLLVTLKPPLVISDLTKLEFASALARWVRMNEISEAQAHLIENTFSRDSDTGLYELRSLTAGHYKQAERWLASRKTALRTLDALHLACCWSLGLSLITCDSLLDQAAAFFSLESIVVRG